MDDLPFHGRTFLVVTSEDLVERVSMAVREKGGEAIPFATIRVIPPKDFADLDRGLRVWRTLDWVVFTSAHGVEAVVERSKALGVDLTQFSGNVAAVGPATKAAAEASGLSVLSVPDEFLTDALAETLGDVRGRTILLPRSRIARKGLAAALRERGGKVIEADAYDAIPAAPQVELIRRASRIDIVLLTSASAVTYLVGLLSPDVRARLLEEAEAACIGPITAEAARSVGFRIGAVAREHTVRGLIDSVAEVRAHG